MCFDFHIFLGSFYWWSQYSRLFYVSLHLFIHFLHLVDLQCCLGKHFLFSTIDLWVWFYCVFFVCLVLVWALISFYFIFLFWPNLVCRSPFLWRTSSCLIAGLIVSCALLVWVVCIGCSYLISVRACYCSLVLFLEWLVSMAEYWLIPLLWMAKLFGLIYYYWCLVSQSGSFWASH